MVVIPVPPNWECKEETPCCCCTPPATANITSVDLGISLALPFSLFSLCCLICAFASPSPASATATTSGSPLCLPSASTRTRAASYVIATEQIPAAHERAKLDSSRGRGSVCGAGSLVTLSRR